MFKKLKSCIAFQQEVITQIKSDQDYLGNKNFKK